jgi:hypothetical protein
MRLSHSDHILKEVESRELLICELPSDENYTDIQLRE